MRDYKNGFRLKQIISVVLEQLHYWAKRQGGRDLHCDGILENRSDGFQLRAAHSQHHHDRQMYPFRYSAKQYIYNTLKLFLFLELFTVVGQVIVIFHPLMKPNDEDYFLVDKDKSVIN